MLGSNLKLDKFHRWVSNLTPSDRHANLCDRRYGATGSWLLETDGFQTWKSHTNTCSLLWIHGIMGSGKSVQASKIIDVVSEHCDNDQGGPWGLAYFYFDFNDTAYQAPMQMVRSILLQLGMRNRATERFLNEKLRSYYDARRPLTTGLIFQTLEEMIKKFKTTYIILDALDECTDWPQLLEVIDQILGCPMTKLLIVSRNEAHIGDHIRSMDAEKRIISLHGDGVSKDMRAYIQSKWGRDLKPWAIRLEKPERRMEIEEELISKAEGM